MWAHNLIKEKEERTIGSSLLFLFLFWSRPSLVQVESNSVSPVRSRPSCSSLLRVASLLQPWLSQDESFRNSTFHHRLPPEVRTYSESNPTVWAQYQAAHLVQAYSESNPTVWAKYQAYTESNPTVWAKYQAAHLVQAYFKSNPTVWAQYQAGHLVWTYSESNPTVWTQ